MKYIVKNKKTGEETLCEKVEVGGWFYYVAGKANKGDYGYLNFQGGDIKIIGKYFADDWLKVIATNNKSLDLPQVVDEVETEVKNYITNRNTQYWTDYDFRNGYNKAKETFEYTKEDMVEFTLWTFRESFKNGTSGYEHEKLLNLWQEQRTKTIIVE